MQVCYGLVMKRVSQTKVLSENFAVQIELGDNPAEIASQYQQIFYADWTLAGYELSGEPVAFSQEVKNQTVLLYSRIIDAFTELPVESVDRYTDTAMIVFGVPEGQPVSAEQRDFIRQTLYLFAYSGF